MTKAEAIVVALAIIFALFGFLWRSYAPHRATAALGYAFISANTRMHDLGNVAGWRGEKRIRGGGYWGVADEEVRDLAAWVDFAEGRGCKKVILVGHSAGWAAVRSYQAEEQDSRVVGVVLASGAVRAETRPTDPDQLAEAKRLMAAGETDALIRDPKRSSPSYISAQHSWPSPTLPRNTKTPSAWRKTR